ncbi:hypothetical protein [Ruegeria lacuscaerulensis]|uniref:hypothetical protein n=1 Tax=Ruegeria lacuscaerulensis TaxID=55218 RepID=UPI00147F6C0D|nr:hypothetical protein [Ruegeria lacuscaerulensis]
MRMPAWLSTLFLLAFFSFCSSYAVSANDLRIVPQLNATRLAPRTVQFNPGKPDILFVLNKFGRIDILDVSQLDRPMKHAEILTGALSAAFSPDGSLIASGGPDGTVRLWELNGALVGAPFKGHGDWVRSVAFSPDGTRIVSAGDDGTIRLWELDGTLVGAPFEGHVGSVLSVAFSPDGTRIVSGGVDGTIRLWELDGTLVGAPFEGHVGSVLSVAFSPDGMRIVSGGAAGTMRQWALDGTPFEMPSHAYRYAVLSVAYSPDGTQIVTGGGSSYVTTSNGADGSVRLWGLDGKAVGPPFESQGRSVSSVAFSPDGTRIVSAGDDGTVRLWQLDGTPAGIPLEGQGNWVLSAAFSPDGRRVASGGEGGIVRFWELDGTPLGSSRERHGDYVTSLAFSPDGMRIVSGADDGTLRLWELNGTPVGQPFGGHDWWVASVAFSPDGTRIVSGGNDGKVRLWALDGSPVGKPFDGHGGNAVWSVSFSPDGTRIVSGGIDGTLRLWEIDGTPLGKPIEAHVGPVYSLAFSPDGTRFVSAGDDGLVRLWALDGKPVGLPFKGHGSPVRSAAFSLDGTRIVSGEGDGNRGYTYRGETKVQVWELDGTPVHAPVEGCNSSLVGYLATDRLAAWCIDRLAVFDARLDLLGSVFFRDGAAVAVLNGEGAHFSGDDARSFLKTFSDSDGKTASLDETPPVTQERVRQVLLNDWHPLGRAFISLEFAAKQAQAVYQRQHAVIRLSFWPVLVWSIVVFAAFLSWLVVPAWLCSRFLPKAVEPDPPPWKWLVDVVTTFGWASRTGRPVKAWLRKHRHSLERACFLERRPVVERERYAEVTMDGALELLTANRLRGARLIAWVHGVGGSGKSSYAFAYARRHLVGRKDQPMPVLVDEDWEGSLTSHVAGLLRLTDWDRGPTETIVKRLGSAGLLCPIVDSLSERSSANAANYVEHAIKNSHFRHLIVTSRENPHGSTVWQSATIVATQPLSRNEVPAFVKQYVEDVALRREVNRRIASFVDADLMPNPLFLRFAVEQAMKGELGSTKQVDLVLRYVEAARIDRVDVNGDDFLRAASHAAVEAVRGNRLFPRELDFEFLNGVLVKVADVLPFLNVNRSNEVPPSKIIEELLSSGILNRNARNRRIQFAYDPVAEYLAAWRLEKSPAEERILRAIVEDAPTSSVAQALEEIVSRRERTRKRHSNSYPPNVK